ncbi:MAG TPA: GPP34 family phosphoprotein [Pseudonocardiaceae bacterium]
MSSRTPPDTLPVTLCLLAWDAGRQRFAQGQELGYVLRGAALADLSLRGCLSEDEDGKVKASGTKRTGDRVLDDVLREIADGRPRSWGYWVRRGARPTMIAVQNQLAAANVVRVECRRVLGILPYRLVIVTDPAVASATRASMRQAVTGRARVSDRDAAVVALVAAGDLRNALSRQERKEHEQRVTACTDRAPALRKVMRGVKSARANARAGGGG